MLTGVFMYSTGGIIPTGNLNQLALFCIQLAELFAPTGGIISPTDGINSPPGGINSPTGNWQLTTGNWQLAF